MDIICYQTTMCSNNCVWTCPDFASKDPENEHSHSLAKSVYLYYGYCHIIADIHGHREVGHAIFIKDNFVVPAIAGSWTQPGTACTSLGPWHYTGMMLDHTGTPSYIMLWCGINFGSTRCHMWINNCLFHLLPRMLPHNSVVFKQVTVSHTYRKRSKLMWFLVGTA